MSARSSLTCVYVRVRTNPIDCRVHVVGLTTKTCLLKYRAKKHQPPSKIVSTSESNTAQQYILYIVIAENWHICNHTGRVRALMGWLVLTMDLCVIAL